MKDRDLLKVIEAGELSRLPNAMLWYGEEEYIKEGAFRRLSARALPEGLAAMNLNAFDERAADDDIIAACETLPMMVPQRIVIARDPAALCAARPSEAETDRLAGYLGRVPDETLLILYVRGKADARRKAFKAVDARDGVIAFDRLDEAQAVRWLARRVEVSGGIGPEAASAVVARIGCDLTALSGEADKLSAYADGREIRVSDVEALVPRSLEGSVFALIDAALEGRGNAAWTALLGQLRMGESPVAALSLLGRAARQAYAARRSLDAGASEQQTARTLGISVYAARHVARRARARGADWWRAAVQAALAAEDDVKSGRAREDLAVDRLIAQLIEASSARG